MVIGTGSGSDINSYEFFEIRHKIMDGYILTGNTSKQYVERAICSELDIIWLSVLLSGLCHSKEGKDYCLTKAKVDKRYLFVVRLCIDQIKDKLSQGERLPSSMVSVEKTINMKW